MTKIIRIEMMDKEIKMVPYQNMITSSSIKSAFLLANDAIVSMSFKLDDEKICCQMNEAGTAFVLPDDWPAFRFFVESRSAHSRPARPIDVRPIVSPYSEDLSPPPPMSKFIDKWMFYAIDSAGKSTVVCVHPRYFVTSRHGTHLLLQVGSVMTIYHAKNEREQVNVENGYDLTVVEINKELDFILLRSNVAIVQRGPQLIIAKESEAFLLAGFGDVNSGRQELSYLTGTVYSIRGYHFFLNNSTSTQLMGPFHLGTGQSFREYSGGACWSSRGLIGINYGITSMEDFGFTLVANSEAATYSPKNIISPALNIENSLMRQLLIDRRNSPIPPSTKRKLMQTEVEGLGPQTLFVDEEQA